MGEKLVSIVIPVYNIGDKIKTCLESVLNQDYQNIEIIIVNDGSTDSTDYICRQYEKTDNRIKYFSIDNQGSGPARNFGIKNSNGRYIYFPDSDDNLEPSAISIMVNAMDVGGTDLVVFGYRKINSNGHVVNVKKYPEFFNDGNSIRENYSEYYLMGSKYGIQGAPWNKFFDLKKIKDNNISFPALRRHQDECFISNYMCYVEKVHFIPDILYTYYENSRYMEWKKYPENYFDIVVKLHNERKRNIYIWNRNDESTHYIADVEYLNGIIKSLELSLASKNNQGYNNRYSSLVEKIRISNICEMKFETLIGRYNNMIYLSMVKGRYRITYLLLKIGSFLKKHSIIANW